jgi:hypothetical protein
MTADAEISRLRTRLDFVEGRLDDVTRSLGSLTKLVGDLRSKVAPPSHDVRGRSLRSHPVEQARISTTE